MKQETYRGFTVMGLINETGTYTVDLYNQDGKRIWGWDFVSDFDRVMKKAFDIVDRITQ